MLIWTVVVVAKRVVVILFPVYVCAPMNAVVV